MNWRAMLRPACFVVGHSYSATMLPEEVFGYSAYSRTWCSRCGWTLDSYPIEEQIGVLMGYVTLWNDVRPVVEAAQWVTESTFETGPHIEALVTALNRYESLYPDHRPLPR